ncbi:MAG: sodium-translocating pyrophosphatase [Akkermansiaceae bacterium]|nr:sodium-translocating pyrophosphatase [Akkermansiaceae bacterium]
MDPNTLFWIVPVASVLVLAFAAKFFFDMKKADEGNDRMKEIAGYVREGAMAYLKQQYKVVAIFFVIIAIAFAIMAYYGLQNNIVPVAFLTGGIFSGLAGFIGMKTATYASGRVAQACRDKEDGLNKGLQLAFRSGAVLGLTVVGFGLLDISGWYLILEYTPLLGDCSGITKLVHITTVMLTFGMGASLQALFARVGGGIYTKAADVGADLVGKTEYHFNEDDPRNPATIADNVGDNVGDVAGMGADLYESYAGSILATAALGAAVAAAVGNYDMGLKLVMAPMIIGAVGAILSILGVFMVRTKPGATQTQLMAALNKGINFSGVLIAVFSALVLWALNIENWLGIWGAIMIGLVVGIAIGKVTEYYTSFEFKPVKFIAENATTGPATVIISGIGVGMISTCWPVIFIVLGTIGAYLSAAGAGEWSFTADNMAAGLYGIGIAAVGMLSTLGLTLATDAYGPISDNAGGNAEMSALGDDVRSRTDALDALGNTTAATGKGFAIGSAALTALALLASYIEELKIAAGRLGDQIITISKWGAPVGTGNEVASWNIATFMSKFEVTLMNPKVLLGIFIGAMLSFLFCGLTMNAVGRAAKSMVEEVRRQLSDKDVFEGRKKADYARCVGISTQGAQREMVVPSLIAVVVPVATGLLMGVAGVFGLLAGGLAGGFVLAVFMANSGGAWDNAKKYIETGDAEFCGKHTPIHDASVVGDTVGDPFKDTSGPSLNILIKLMSMVSIVTAGLNIAFSLL